MAADVTLYGNETCPWCGAARMLLTQRGIAYTEKSVSADPAALQEMISRSGSRSVPQIFIGDTHVGGYDELSSLDASGELQELLGK